MIRVRLKGNKCRTMVEDAISIRLRDGLRDLLHVGIALADELVIPDANHVSHKADHCSGLTHGLAVGDLGLALVEILKLQTEEVGAGSKRKARARGVVTEVRNREA